MSYVPMSLYLTTKKPAEADAPKEVGYYAMLFIRADELDGTPETAEKAIDAKTKNAWNLLYKLAMENGWAYKAPSGAVIG